MGRTCGSMGLLCRDALATRPSRFGIGRVRQCSGAFRTLDRVGQTQTAAEDRRTPRRYRARLSACHKQSSLPTSRGPWSLSGVANRVHQLKIANQP